MGDVQMKKVVAGIQARMGSTRLPGKSLMPICSKPLIHWVIDRVKKASKIDEVWILTTTNSEDDALVASVESKVGVVRGYSQDVRSRYNQLIEKTGAFLVVRVTGDCPLVDGALLDAVVELNRQDGAEYSNIQGQPYYETAYPNGFNAEVFSIEAFKRMFLLGNTDEDREHVTPTVDKFPEKFKISRLAPPIELSRKHWKLSVDTAEELQRVRLIAEALGEMAEYASVKDIVAVLDAHSEWQNFN
ncbi:MAG: NTP transferase domain-containing protein [Okeania sp. SIO3I5]|uniref:cytidylyltransferase domain-containing protein n=1 Tax=Okeania sp. SIO3I5 TaxID=2607805 RepID=UPI0013BBF824|nr:NTP transferase domain-containing protein [Okeania sp. SIO3I5]NEQ36714.1 NTP transferase domain-containing protein [Okeania sp. SIO3I5]